MTTSLFTNVQVSRLPFVIDHGSGIVALGSCFADEMASRLSDGGFPVEQNPFGTLYNPESVAYALERIINCRDIVESDLVLHDGLWHSWHHHGSFSRPTVGETLEACNRRLHQACDAMRSARLLIVTFGTAWVFELASRQVVANCHKLPPSMFTRRMLTADGIVALWQPLLSDLSRINPNLFILFTVSPIRHLADGAHGNQLSKATLLLAIDRLLCESSRCSYFPAYEIMLDELRDYRFYGPDMVHPTPLAADIIYQRFQQACMSPATIQQAHNNAKQHKRERHVPLH